jgi:hypothetical protein
MTCAQCQATLPTSAAFCTRCGARVTSAAPAGQFAGTQPPPAAPAPTTLANAPGGPGQPASGPVGGAPVHHGAGVPSFRFDARRLTRADRTIGIASLVTFIALFLPWFGISGDGFSFSESGMSAHGYLAIVLIIAVAIVVYLVLRAGWDKMPMRLPAAHAPLLLIASGLQLIIVVIAFLLKPDGLSWDFGAYLAFLAAVVACAPIAVPAMRSFSENRR